MRRIVASAIGVVRRNAYAMIFLGCVFFSCGESVDTYHATKREAELDGSVERGWIPEMIPESSTHISEYHNLDTNEGFGHFRFNPDEYDSFSRKIQQASLGAEKIETALKRIAGRGWAYGLPPMSQLRSSEFVLFADSHFYIAVQPGSGLGFFWNTFPKDNQ